MTDRGGVVAMKDHNGVTPLYWAMYHRPNFSKLPYGYEVLRILLESGGNINERTANGCRLAGNDASITSTPHSRSIVNQN